MHRSMARYARDANMTHLYCIQHFSRLCVYVCGGWGGGHCVGDVRVKTKNTHSGIENGGK